MTFEVCRQTFVSSNAFVADALLVAAGDDPFALVEESVIAAAKLSGGAKPLRDKHVPATADGFGWCTWDAFYTRVSAAGVRNISEMQVPCRQQHVAPSRRTIRMDLHTDQIDTAAAQQPTIHCALQ